MITVKKINYNELPHDELLRRVKQNPAIIRFIDHPSEALINEAISINGLLLSVIKKQTPTICFKAVKNNWRSIVYVENQTKKIWTEAISQNPMALKHLKKQTVANVLFAFGLWNSAAYQYVTIEMPIAFLIEQYYKTKDQKFKNWIENQSNWQIHNNSKIKQILA